MYNMQMKRSKKNQDCQGFEADLTDSKSVPEPDNNATENLMHQTKAMVQ
jgi:hypothetical protein